MNMIRTLIIIMVLAKAPRWILLVILLAKETILDAIYQEKDSDNLIVQDGNSHKSNRSMKNVLLVIS